MTVSTDPERGPDGAQGWAYLSDSRLRRLETTVVDSGDDPAGSWVQLADTVLTPKAGDSPPIAAPLPA